MRRDIWLIGIGLFLLTACVAVPGPTPISPGNETPAGRTPAIATQVSFPTPYPLLITSPIYLGNYDKLPLEKMVNTLDELFKRIETTHPNLYGLRPKAEVDLERAAITASLREGMNAIDYYKIIAPLVASLGDRHTRVYLSNDVNEIIQRSELFLPLWVSFIGERAFITGTASDHEIPFGTELMAINGTPVSEIQKYLLQPVNETGSFLQSLWELYGSIPEYQVTVILPEASEAAIYTLPGMQIADIYQRFTEKYPREPVKAVSYEKFEGEEDIGLLTVINFEGIVPYLRPVFTQMREDGIRHLIIDIRSNTGGKYDQVDLLMHYLTDKPYQQCSQTIQQPPDRDISQDPLVTECFVVQPPPRPQRFEGEIYLVIGPNTFSAAITFATTLQDYELATLIGEETLDLASYCAFIPDHAQPISTFLSYKCSQQCYVRPSGEVNGRGVIPDLIVKPGIEDLRAGNDPVLEFVLEYARGRE